MRQRDLDLKSQEPDKLLIEIRTLIEEARRQTAVAVNIGLTLPYWRIGRRIHREVLGSERAAYGEQIVVTLSRQLSGPLQQAFAPQPGVPDSGPETGKLPRSLFPGTPTRLAHSQLSDKSIRPSGWGSRMTGIASHRVS
jgi:hypothetical protein